MGDRRAPRRTAATRPTSGSGGGTAGKRKAARHSGPRRSLVPGLPSAPLLAGLAMIAVAAGGAVQASDQVSPTSAATDNHRLVASGASTGSSATASADLLSEREQVVSRDSKRQALDDASEEKVVEAAEAISKERNAALAQFAKQAEKQAKLIALNQWVLPLDSYRLSATFGQVSGLWASTHTGLDFAAPYGAPVKAVANGVVTEVGYDGSYGNKIVVTLDDGTELWFAHLSGYAVDTGTPVRGGDVIGYVGSTGNSTGSHLHLEVRPGAGDPVDPYSALSVHGLAP